MKVFGLRVHMLLIFLTQIRFHAKKNRSQLRGKPLTDEDNVNNSSLVTCTPVNNVVLYIRADNTQLALA